MAPRIGILGMWHETNTYASYRTSVEDFEAFELVAGEKVRQVNRGTGSVIGGFLDATALDLQPLFAASAWPGGMVTADARSAIFKGSLEALRSATGLDGLLINLHGAMVAEDDDDPESSLLEEIREIIPDAPIAGVLDLHANPSPDLARLCDVLISYDTYPHVDMRERGREAAAFMLELCRGRRLQTSIAKLPILAPPIVQATAAEPMMGLQRRAAERARAAGVDRVCITAGYCYSDVTRAGISVLAVHDTNRHDAATHILQDTVRDIEQHAAEFRAVRESPTQAITRALASTERPIVLADTADNVGGGSPGDGTALLRELLEHHAEGAVVIIADAESAIDAIGVTEGGTYRGFVGGKTDTMHGDPVEITGTVIKISDGRYRTQGTWMTGREFSLGHTAVVDASGILVVLTENRVPPFHAEQLTSLGIDPSAMNFIVAKGALAWRAAYGDVAKTVIEVDTPGICPVDPYSLHRAAEPMRV